MIPVEAFIAVNPDAPDATRWILAHRKGVALALDATSHPRHPRMATIDSIQAAVQRSSTAGFNLSFATIQTESVSVRLPRRLAPAHGPKLLAAARQALLDAYQASTVRLAPRARPRGLEALMRAAMTLPGNPANHVACCALACHWNPDTPMGPRARHGSLAGPGSFMADLGTWFAPSSIIGKTHATIIVAGPTHDPSAHEIMEASAAIVDFYGRAASDLGLGETEVRARLKCLGVVT